MSGIHKVPKNRRKEKVEPPKIVGGNAPTGEPRTPKVLDQRTRARPVQIETKEHGEIVTVQSHIRSKPGKKSDPDVRLRGMTAEEKEEWRKVKRMEWES